MLELLKNALNSPAGSFGFILSLMLLAGWVIHYLTKHTAKYKVEREVDKDKVCKVETNLDNINKDIAYIKGAIEIIRSNSQNSLTQAHSPIGLSELGEEIAKKMDIDSMIAQDWDNILSFLDGSMHSKNAYDIQQFCIESASVSIDKMFSPVNVEKIKKFAYNQGKSLFYYGGMIGVKIRDAYFIHKGIELSDVDKHDPSNPNK